MSLRILIADDEEIATRVLADYLKDCGFMDIAVVLSAEAAIEHIEAHRPDLVYLDVNFNTDLSGMHVLRRVRTTAPESRICIMSGYRDECQPEAMSLGAHAFISKPAVMEDYIKVAESLKKLKERSSKAAREN